MNGTKIFENPTNSNYKDSVGLNFRKTKNLGQFANSTTLLFKL